MLRKGIRKASRTDSMATKDINTSIFWRLVMKILMHGNIDLLINIDIFDTVQDIILMILFLNIDTLVLERGRVRIYERDSV